MSGLQYIEYLGAASVQRVGWATGTDNRLVDIRGTGFVNVVDVLINGVPSPEYVEMSPTHLLAVVPTAQLGKGVQTISVLTAGTGDAAAAVIRFRLTSRTQVGGSTAMAQRFLYVLLTTPGSDIFSPTVGAGLRRQVAQSVTPSTRAIIARTVRDAESQMIQAQARDPVPENERLASARLTDLRYDRATSTTSIRVELLAVSGRRTATGIQV